MDAPKFLAEFGLIANAPAGVSKLRDLVLVLAIQGRLVAQARGEHSGALVERIEDEKRSLVATGSLRTPRSLPDVGVAERTHSIPDSWTWVRFGGISMHNSGKTLDSMRNTGHPRDYITTSNLYWGRFELSNVKRMLIRDEEMAKCTARKNDLLICEGGEAGRAAVWTADTEVCFQNHIHRARFYGGINPFFAYRFFQKLNATGEINAHRKGIGISNLSSKALAMIAMPLPPLEEQARIVAKVDELMTLCDKLEMQQQDRRKVQNNLRQSTLQALAAARSPHELQTTWLRFESNFHSLFSTPDDVRELREVVLNLAIGGLLTVRDAEDEIVAQLIARCNEARASRAASGELKRKTAAATEVSQLEMVVPAHWEKVPLDRLFQFIDYRGKTPTKTESGVVLVTAKNVRPGRLSREPIEYISESDYEDWMTRGFPRLGDILFTTEAPLGNAALIEDAPKFALAQRIIDLQPFADLNTRCAMYFMMSPTFQAGLERNSTGMTAKGIKAGKLKQLDFPVPPVEEQARIVERVEAILLACDKLEAELSGARKVAERLAIAVVSGLTGIAIDQQENDTMKAPETELIATLRIGTPPDVKAQAPLATMLVRHNGEMSASDLWQRFGGEVDAFYTQLKTEVGHGWILDPAVAEMREKSTEASGA